MTKIHWLNPISARFTDASSANGWSGAAGSLTAAQASGSGFSLNVATGQNASGVIQTTGDLADANWTVTNADNYQNAPISYTVAPGEADFGYPWLANGPYSSWICADPTNADNGNMTFTFKFDLTGYNPADATLVGGAFSADDLGTVYLNGHSLGSQTVGGWEVLNPLSNGAGDFVAGVNTLVIQVTRADGIDEAARLEGTIVDTVTTNPPGPVHWANAVNGDFTTAADWTAGFVPGAANDAILDAAGITLYSVTSSASETVNSVQTAASATLAITGGTFTANSGTGGGINAGVISVSNSATLTLGGTVNNTGSIVMAGGDRGTDMFFTGAGATFTGGGQVTFLANSGAGGGGALTNIDNTISGDLNFYLASLVNDSAGVIDAINVNVPQSELSAGTIDNRGLIESTGPNPLLVSANVLYNVGGVILAGNGSGIDLSGEAVPLTLVEGTLKTSGTGVIYVHDVIFRSTVNNQGAVVVADDHSLFLDGTTNNSGSLSLGAASHPTFVEVGANAVLTGGGKVILGDSHFNAITGGAVFGAALTNVDNTISGAGSIGVYGNLGAAFYLVNEAAGVIDANGAVGLILETGPDTVTNAGLMEGTGTAGLTLRSTSVDSSTGGVILAGNASHVGLQGATLIGGTLQSLGTGIIRTFGGGNGLDGTVTAVNNQATLIVADNTSLTLQGTLNNTGKVGISSTGVAATLTIGAAGATLTGGGRFLLNSSTLNTITGASSAATLTNVDNNLSGAGQIGAGAMTLINEAKGVIVGSQAASLTLDTGVNAIVNAGIILSRGAGGLTIQSAVANSGILESDGGVLTVSGAVSGAGQAMIYAGTLNFTSSFSQNVVFQKTTGVLELAQSQNYTGTVFGFSKTGGTSLDLRDIGFVGSSEATFSGTASGGVLTVTDGTHTAHITLRGDYRASTFTASSDGHGGTIVVDPAAASATAAHRFISAAAGMASAAGAAIHTGEAWSVREPVLVRPRAMPG